MNKRKEHLNNILSLYPEEKSFDITEVRKSHPIITNPPGEPMQIQVVNIDGKSVVESLSDQDVNITEVIKPVVVPSNPVVEGSFVSDILSDMVKDGKIIVADGPDAESELLHCVKPLVTGDGTIVIKDSGTWGGLCGLHPPEEDGRQKVGKELCGLINYQYRCMLFNGVDPVELSDKAKVRRQSVWHMYVHPTNACINIHTNDGKCPISFGTKEIGDMIKEGILDNVYDVIGMRDRLCKGWMSDSNWLMIHISTTMYVTSDET